MPVDLQPLEPGRTGQASDWVAAVDLYRTAFSRPPYREAISAADAEAALTGLLRRGGEVLLAHDGDEVVALAGGEPREPGRYHLDQLAVHPDRQGAGLGRRLLTALLDHPPVREAACVEVWTKADNHPALGLYQANGFVPDGAAVVVPRTDLEGRSRLHRSVRLTRPGPATASPCADPDRLHRVAVTYPSGNATAVVFDQHRLDEDRATLNRRLIRGLAAAHPDLPGIEQCCFVTEPSDPRAIARMEMFGGEFCGNAARSVVHLATRGRPMRGWLEASGVRDPLAFEVDESGVRLNLPLPEDAEVVRPTSHGVLVGLEGITHLVVAGDELPGDAARRALLDELRDGPDAGGRDPLLEQGALGVTCWQPDATQAAFSVWVDEVDTVFDETACGSGTGAIAVALAHQRRAPVEVDVGQPSGRIIRAGAHYAGAVGRVAEAWIAGEVEVRYDGEVMLR